VYALVVGVIAAFDAMTQNGETVLCRPHVFHDGTFPRACDLRIARSASRVILHRDRRIEAIGLVADQNPAQKNRRARERDRKEDLIQERFPYESANAGTTSKGTRPTAAGAWTEVRRVSSHASAATKADSARRA